jgi:DNA repair exonuclease SbcCD ATPase subunit
MLQLKKLALNNVGVLKGNKIISFEEGMNIIQANNGSGKSTLIQVIELLLTNQYEGSYIDYINDSSNDMTASLEFSFNDVDYKIVLSCKRGKTTSTSKVLYNGNNNEIASGEEAVSFMNKLFDPMLTKYSLVAKQKAVDNIVSCKDSERLDLFKKIKELNLEKHIKKHLEPLMNEIKTRIVDVEKEVYRLEHTEYDIKELKKTEVSEADVILLRKQLQELSTKKSKQETLVKEYNEVKEKVEVLKKSVEAITEKLNKKRQALVSSIDTLTELKSDEYKQSKLKDLLNNHNKELERLQNDIVKLQNDYELRDKEFITSIELSTSAVETLENEIVSIKVLKLSKFDDSQLKHIENEIAKTKQDITYCNNNITSLEKGICPTCDSKCEHKLQEWIDKKKQFEKTLTQLNESLIVANKSKTEYENSVKENDDNKIKKQQLLSSKDLAVEKLESSQSKYKETLLSIKKQITEKELQIEKEKKSYIASVALIENNINEVVAQEEKHNKDLLSDTVSLEESLNNEVSLLQSCESVFSKKVLPSEEDFSKIELFEKQIKDYESIIIENEVVKENNSKLVEKEKADKILLQEKSKEVLTLKEELSNCEQAKVILLKDFPNYVIESSIKDVEVSMNNFIDLVYYKSLNVSLRPTNTSIKLEYGLHDNKLSAHRLSGAESRITSLSFINHFNKVTGLSCLILDEPDAALSDGVAHSLYESLIAMNNLYKQMIVVTHNEKMRNYLIANGQASVIQL